MFKRNGFIQSTLFLFITLSFVPRLSYAEGEIDWTPWRRTCFFYGACYFNGVYYVVKKDGDRYKVSSATQIDYERELKENTEYGVKYKDVDWSQRGGEELTDSAFPNSAKPAISGKSSQPTAGRGNKSQEDTASTPNEDEVDELPLPPNPKNKGKSANSEIKPKDLEKSKKLKSQKPADAEGVTKSDEDTEEVARGATEGGESAVPGQNPCGINSQVIEAYNACKSEFSSVKFPSSCPITILDARKGQFSVMKGDQCLMRVPAGIGPKRYSGQAPRSKDMMTPPGLHKLIPADGVKYSAGGRTGTGLDCISRSDCGDTDARSIVIHGAKRNKNYKGPKSGANPSGIATTAGCTRLSDSNYSKYHSISKGGSIGCPYFVYYPEMKCGKRGAASVGQPKNKKNKRGNQ